MVFLTKWTIRKVLQIRGISPHFIFGEKGVMDQFGTVVFVGVHKDFANVNGGKRCHHFARISFSNTSICLMVAFLHDKRSLMWINPLSSARPPHFQSPDNLFLQFGVNANLILNNIIISRCIP